MVEPEGADDLYLHLDLPREFLLAKSAPQATNSGVVIRSSDVTRSEEPARSAFVTEVSSPVSRAGVRVGSSWKPNRSGIVALGGGTVMVIVALGIAGIRLIDGWSATDTAVLTYSKSSAVAQLASAREAEVVGDEPAFGVSGSIAGSNSATGDATASLELPAPSITTAPSTDPTQAGAPLSEIPSHIMRVTDAAHLLTPVVRGEIETALAAHEHTTTNQIAILTVRTTQPESIDEYSLRVANTWKLGQGSKTNSVLVVVVQQDRRVRISAGPRLELTLSEGLADKIISDAMAEPVRQGNYDKAVREGVAALTAVLETTSVGANLNPTPK